LYFDAEYGNRKFKENQGEWKSDGRQILVYAAHVHKWDKEKKKVNSHR
jgi:hypothetical protein